jgi:hypothetical protein
MGIGLDINSSDHFIFEESLQKMYNIVNHGCSSEDLGIVHR